MSLSVETVTSDVYPDYWMVPDGAQSDQPQGAFGVDGVYSRRQSGYWSENRYRGRRLRQDARYCR